MKGLHSTLNPTPRPDRESGGDDGSAGRTGVLRSMDDTRPLGAP